MMNPELKTYIKNNGIIITTMREPDAEETES
jgi:hypothetical protein